MFEGCITDIRGLWAAHQSDAVGKTGCTIVVAPKGAIGAVDVRGGAPGTRETDAFSPLNLVERVHAVMLCGGSAFGLCAADGAMRYLEEQGIGFDVAVAKVPIVGAAVLFDLGVGDPMARPTADMGYLAAKNANAEPLFQGPVGAGTGATVCKLLGPAGARQGGFGCASMKAGKGTVAAAFAVNALGNLYDYRTGACIKAPHIPGSGAQGQENTAGTNTTIGVIATDVILTKTQAKRLAMLAHDGLAMAIRPVHSMYDGDTAFALSTAAVEENPDMVFAMAAEVVARAIYNAVTANEC